MRLRQLLAEPAGEPVQGLEPWLWGWRVPGLNRRLVMQQVQQPGLCIQKERVLRPLRLLVL